MDMNKRELRAIYKEKRNRLSDRELSAISSNVQHQLFTHFELKNKRISLFLTIVEKHEINVYPILEELLEHKNQIVVSKSIFKTREMELYLYEDRRQLAVSNHGIPEPQYGTKIAVETLEVVLVPLMIFDKSGYRVGFGGGFYDRFLSKCSDDCLFIGLSMEEPVEIINDTDEHDIRLDYCVTPKNFYNFTNKGRI